MLEDWEPAKLEENVYAVNEEEMTDAELFAQSSPTETREAMSRMWETTKRIFRKLDRIGDALCCTSGEATNTVPQIVRARRRRRE